MAIDLSQIGANVAAARIRSGMSQKELGEKLGVDQSMVSLWERGKFEIRLTQLVRIADVLGVPLDSLMGRETEEGSA